MDGHANRRCARTTAAAALAAAAVVLLLAALIPARAAAGPPAIIAVKTPTTLKGLEEAARGQRLQMARLEAQMQVIRTQYDAAVAELNGVDLQLSQTRLQLSQSQAALDQQSALIGARLAAMYKMGSFSFVDVLAASTTLTDMQTQITFFRRLTEQDQQDDTGLVQLNARIGRLADALTSQRASSLAAQSRVDEQRLIMSDKIAQRRAILDNLTRQIERLLAPQSSGGGLAKPVPLSGHYTPVTWAKALLQQLGMPLTAPNIAAVTAWEVAEGGHWHNSAHYNPLDTTMPEPGATAMNSVGVKAYVSWAQGFTATIATLRNGYYGSILAALRAGNDAIAVADAVAASPWGTGNFASLL
jgi:peptidoglycan hydrolase CwlO-like protein